MNQIIGNVGGGFSQEFLQRVGMGLEPGWSFVDKFGENPDIDGPFEDIWDGGGAYVPPTAPRIHDVASTLAADAGTLVSSGAATGGSVYTLIDTGATFITDGVAVGDKVLNDSKCTWGNISAVTIVFGMRYPSNGLVDGPFESGDAYRVVRDASTGASIFWIQGLDANLLGQDEFVILNGTTPVPTTKTYFRQFRARVFTSGNSGAVGVITSTAQVDGTVSCQIIDGNNQTLMSIYTIPVNKEGFILYWWASLSKKQAANSVVHFRAGRLNEVGYIQQTRAVSSTGSSDFPHKFQIPLRITGGADIWMQADASTTDVGISGGFTVLMRDLSAFATPTPQTCTKDSWEPVATGITTGNIHLQEFDPHLDIAFFAVVKAGEAAPTVAPMTAGSKAVQFEARSVPISNGCDPIDLYVYALGADVSAIVAAK
jgi:hypothetical protein